MSRVPFADSIIQFETGSRRALAARAGGLSFRCIDTVFMHPFCRRLANEDDHVPLHDNVPSAAGAVGAWGEAWSNTGVFIATGKMRTESVNGQVGPS